MTQTQLSSKIASLLSTVSAGRFHLDPEDYSRPLKDLGVDSVMLLNLLVAIEANFNYEWSEDADDKIFVSISSLSDHLITEVGL